MVDYEAIKSLKSSEKGLTTAQAKQRLENEGLMRRIAISFSGNPISL